MKQLILRIIVCAIVALCSARAQTVVIVNKTAPVHSLSARAILDMYAMNVKEWPDGSPVVPVTLKGSEPVALNFYASLGTRLLDMKKLWMRMLLSGEEKVPIAVTSEENVVVKVASTPGAIGYVRKEWADSSVRVVAVLD